jgi:hypothetical protein
MAEGIFKLPQSVRRKFDQPVYVVTQFSNSARIGGFGLSSFNIEAVFARFYPVRATVDEGHGTEAVGNQQQVTETPVPNDASITST